MRIYRPHGSSLSVIFLQMFILVTSLLAAHCSTLVESTQDAPRGESEATTLGNSWNFASAEPQRRMLARRELRIPQPEAASASSVAEAEGSHVTAGQEERERRDGEPECKESQPRHQGAHDGRQVSASRRLLQGNENAETETRTSASLEVETTSISSPIQRTPVQLGSRVLLAATLTGNCGGVAANPYGRGIAFLMLNPSLGKLYLFLADLSGISKPVAAQVIYAPPGAINGGLVATLVTADTNVAITELGYSFSGAVPLASSVLFAILNDPTSYIINVITAQQASASTICGRVLSVANTASVLPGLLFPKAMLESGGLASALSSITYLSASATFNLTIVSETAPDPNQAAPEGDFAYFNLTLGVQALAMAMPAALQSFSSTSSTDDAANLQGATALSSFLCAIMPTLPALTDRQPSVGSGQLVEAGTAALLATVIGYVGYQPPLDGPQFLGALTAALNAALVTSA
eukprot:jgi/Mesen1/2901/ME000175S02059